MTMAVFRRLIDKRMLILLLLLMQSTIIVNHAFTIRQRTLPTRTKVHTDQNPIDMTPLKVLLSTGQTRLSSNANNHDGLQLSFRKNHQQRDVVIVGGALAGLSTALYLSQMDPTRHITILDRETYGSSSTSKTKQPVASYAAAGMLAPQSERLPSGPLLDLCVSSREMYPDFCEMVESFAKESGDDGAQFLFDNEFVSLTDDVATSTTTTSTELDPWSVGYVATGGFLAPAFAGDAVATWAPPDEGGTAIWLDSIQVRELEPTLHPDVIGGWWFPDDASVDARRLTCSLRAACVAVGVQFLTGPQYEVASLDLAKGVCKGLWLQSTKKARNSGPRYISAQTVLIANGAWMRQLLPVPIESHKGQSVALRMPSDRPPILRRVIFAQDTYIVPKADGRIVIGATVEAGKYDGNVTPMGLLHIITHAVQMIPALKDLPIEESWAGLRPTTPDKGPILGKTPWSNLFIAGGYWRNGVLLAPKTGQLLASLIVASTVDSSGMSKQAISTKDEEFLNVFAWDRFTNSEKSATVAADARFAASMHPIHTRSSIGVSAAVGTELGSYSSARAATNERQKDRDSLSGADSEAGFERAAALGIQDSLAYTYDDANNDVDDPWVVPVVETDRKLAITETSYYMDGAADALTVGSATVVNDDDENVEQVSDIDFVKVASNSGVQKYEPIRDSTPEDLKSMYAAIQANKTKKDFVLTQGNADEQPDPGFRICYVDENTGVEFEIPPYTSPGEFLASLEKDDKVAVADGKEGRSDYDETTYDGYQTIQQSNSRDYRQDELEVMREARRKNRLGQTELDYSKIGAQPLYD